MKRHLTATATGIIQGIGFRPFCKRLAEDVGVSGSVRNTPNGVSLDLYGPRSSIDLFLDRLRRDCPTLGHIQSITVINDQSEPELHPDSFEILESCEGEGISALIPPDIATCEDCLAEMRDPKDRRYGYPFINCTACGPRFSIISAVPYDRCMTSMSSFPLCGLCREEYYSPANRRFHAQPVACRDCGPQLALLDGNGVAMSWEKEALDDCVSHISKGAIAAVKGLGGFHLACLARDGQVAKLRNRKNRPHKPFALMVRDLETAEKIVYLTKPARVLLESACRPIVICPKKKNEIVSDLVAPMQDCVGIMLPYTPLHHLILEKLPVLVMTSANVSDAPLVSENAEALKTLFGIADFFLLHDRDIIMKIDDSVVAMAGKRPILMRRGRGFVPQPIAFHRDMPQILAAGAEMKSTFSLAVGRNIIVSQYLGDLKEMPSAIFYDRALRHFLSLFGMRPRLLAADLHPSFPCTAIARKIMGEPEDVLLVQHHHAHMAACLAENGHRGPAIGIILDGTGLGIDRTVWGGEFLVGDLTSFVRKGRFRRAALPGGDRSVLEPWRFALSLLANTFGMSRASEEAHILWPEMHSKIGPVLSSLEKSPVTTSCGRLFDAVSALLGIIVKVSYDGQAAMELESSARGGIAIAPFGISNEGGEMVLDWRPAIRWIIEESVFLGKGRASAAFHFGLAEAISNIALEISKDTGLKVAALSGGVWQNRRLSSITISMLKKRGLQPLFHTSLSPNDECVSVGQAVIAAEHWKGILP